MKRFLKAVISRLFAPSPSIVVAPIWAGDEPSNEDVAYANERDAEMASRLENDEPLFPIDDKDLQERAKNAGFYARHFTNAHIKDDTNG